MKNLILVLLFLSSVESLAAGKSPRLSRATQNHLTIHSVEVLDLTEQYKQRSGGTKRVMEVSGGVLEQMTIATEVADKADLILDKVINMGAKTWNVVEKGRPIQTFQNTAASALPKNAVSWNELEGWKQPVSRVIGLSYKNVYGSEVVRFVYRVILLAGGSSNGVGQYIGSAAVEPENITTAYMYTFNAQAVVTDVYNKGTRENPLAGMRLTVRWTIETVLKKSTGSHSFYLDGLGNIENSALTTLK